jgi:hypothetical protein
MPRFAVLEHDHPTLHWDFLLEDGGVLLTWRLAAPPTPDVVVHAEKLFDHRLLYLDYEGPVGGGRGRVTRWDNGTFEWEERGADRAVVRLIGGRLHGVFRLERADGETWRAHFMTAPEAGS